jgi:hypothetical protein
MNYSAIVNSHTLQFNRARTKSSQLISISRFLLTDPNTVLYCSCICRIATFSHLNHGSECPHVLDCLKVNVKVVLRPTVSPSVCLGVKHPPGASHPHANMFIVMILYDLCLLPAQFYYTYNRIHTRSWKPRENRGPVCTLENFKRCGETCFVGAAIIRGRCLPLIPRRSKRKSLLIWSVPCGGLVYCWHLNAHFEFKVDSNKCSEGLGFNHFYV